MNQVCTNADGAESGVIRFPSAGRVLFAAAMIWLGAMGLDVVQVWQPVPRWVPALGALAYLCTAISLAGGLGLLWRRTARAFHDLPLVPFGLMWVPRVWAGTAQ